MSSSITATWRMRDVHSLIEGGDVDLQWTGTHRLAALIKCIATNLK